MPSRILLRPIPRILMRGLLTAETCTMLGVPALGVWATSYQPFLRLAARTTNMSASDVFRDLPVTAQLSALVSQRLLDELVNHPRGGQRTAFHMPDRLAKRWGITPS